MARLGRGYLRCFRAFWMVFRLRCLVVEQKSSKSLNSKQMTECRLIVVVYNFVLFCWRNTERVYRRVYKLQTAVFQSMCVCHLPFAYYSTSCIRARAHRAQTPSIVAVRAAERKKMRASE